MRSAFQVLFLIFIGLCCLPQSVVGQDGVPDIQNLGSMDVDALSDEQIQKLLDKLESSGYTEQQLEVMAMARGMSSVQISKLRQRINEVRLKGGAAAEGSSKSISRTRKAPELDYNKKSNAANRSTPFDPYGSVFPMDTAVMKKQLVDGLEIFGLSFFDNEYLTFEPSLSIATPENYRIGAGDQIIIDVWGASEQTYQLEVSPSGSIIIPSIGPIFLNGLTIDDAAERIKHKLRAIYSTLGKNTFAQVSLGQIRTISVNVVGEVELPGTYQLSSFANAFNALYMAGGPDENGSLRNIQVFRGGIIVATLDAYDFLVFGSGENIRLQDQDVILVKPYQNRVAVRGEVKRPALYEMNEGESLSKVIGFAGGFTADAYTKSISIRRNLDNKKTVETVQKAQFDHFVLKAGDELEVGAIQNQFVDRVRVEGAVNHPGEFKLKEGLMLSEVIGNYADGLRADAFQDRGVILRQNDDLSLSSIAFNPKSVMKGYSDFLLQSEDLIRIQSKFDLREEYSVTIEGEVLAPGKYPYAEGMTVEDLIYLANGFRETAAKSFVEVARRVTSDEHNGEHTAKIYNFPISEDLSLGNTDAEFILKPFDLVVIRESPFYERQDIVEVEGEVKYPGKYVLEAKNERISDIIRRAGGPSKYGYLNGATLIRRTEYYGMEDNKKPAARESGEEVPYEAARIRREELKTLLERDTEGGLKKVVFKAQESIGIQLREILDNPGSEYDLILKEGDIISVPRELQTVRIRGQVLYPSTVRYDGSNSFKNLISQAGGFTNMAKKNKAYIIYANGSAQRTRSFLGFKDYPKVEPGAEVIIPKKPEKEKLSPQAWISLTGGLATLSLVVIQILNQLEERNDKTTNTTN